MKSKESVQYTDRAMVQSERCKLCTHFLKPSSCELVSGEISPGGWCKLFKKEAA